MRASPDLLILEAAVGLLEERLKRGAPAARDDMRLLGKQLHRLNLLYLRLAEIEAEPPEDLPPWR